MIEQKAPRILVIDDEVTQRMLVKEYLEEAGYQVRLAEDGRHGLKMAATLNVDLIILDVMLPSLDGYTVCSCLRQQPKTEHVPIILITGSKEADAFTKGLAAGATDFITKPVEWQFLADRVAHVLEQSKHYRKLHSANLRMEEELRAAGHDKTSAELEQSNAELEDQVQAIKAEREAALVRAKTELEQQRRTVEAEAEAKVLAAATVAERELQELKDRYELRLADAQAAADAALDEERNSWREQLRAAEAAATLHFEQARAAHEAQVRALETAMQQKLGPAQEQPQNEQLIAAAANRELWRVKDELARSRASFWRFCQILGQQQLGRLDTLLHALETGDAGAKTALGAARELAAAVHRFRILANHMVEGAQINEKVVDVGALISSVVSAMEPQCRDRAVSIEMPGETGIKIFGDELRLEFLLLNLLSNAVRFSLSGAVVRIEPQIERDGSLRIAVRDCGTGIAPGVLDKLKSALDMPTNMLTGPGGQIGFGIPIAAAIAKLHGGHLELASAIGQGTSACLLLPCERVTGAVDSSMSGRFGSSRARLG